MLKGLCNNKVSTLTGCGFAKLSFFVTLPYWEWRSSFSSILLFLARAKWILYFCTVPKLILFIPFALIAVDKVSYAEENLKNFNRGTELLLEGNPEEALVYLGEVSLENRAPYLEKPMQINSRIALIQAAKKLEGSPLAGAYRKIAMEIGNQVLSFPEAFSLLQEKKFTKDNENPYPSTKQVISAKKAAEKALLALKLARGVKFLKISSENLNEEIISFAQKSKKSAKRFLEEWQNDEQKAYEARFCLENISVKVRPLIFDATNALDDAISLLKESPQRFMVPGSLIEEAIFHFDQVLQLTNTLPEEKKPEEEKSAEQKVVEMELQDRVQKKKVRVKDEVERPW